MRTIYFVAIFLLLSLVLPQPVFAAKSFPWGHNQDWYWLSRGGNVWHTSCTNSCAIDFGTTSDYKQVYAMDKGKISRICTSASTVDITIIHNNLSYGYFHIDRRSFPDNHFTDSHIRKGEYLGEVKTGSFVEPSSCGYTVTASQNTQTGHLHLKMDNYKVHYFDSWRFVPGRNNATRQHLTTVAGETFISLNSQLVDGGVIRNPITIRPKTNLTLSNVHIKPTTSRIKIVAVP